MAERQRLPADVRKQQILDSAFGYARDVGYDFITRDGVAAAAGVSTGQVTRVFGNVSQLRDEVIGRAVKAAKDGDDSKQTMMIIARGLMIGNVTAQKASDAIKRKALTAAL